jgi:molybdopterin/thiamine biosynthesis adenylyltransferase
MSDDRFNRNERLFGKEGQKRLRRTRVLVAGAGGLGSHVIAQAALLGAGGVGTVDREELSLSNRNRYVGAWHADPIPGTTKVALAQRHIQLIDHSIEVTAINDDIVSKASLGALTKADFVIGCVDDDGVRFFLNEACLAYRRPLIDLASDVPEPGVFGGRVVIVTGGHGCLHCLDLLDPNEVRRFFSSTEMVENEAAAYGVRAEALAETGPSVVSVNGVVASLGVTAFMAMATGMPPLPYSLLTYRGDLGTVTRKMTTGVEGCYYCTSVRGMGDRANLDRYFIDAAARWAKPAA